MTIFHFAFIGVILFAFVLKYIIRPKSWEKIFCVVSGSVYFLIATLRHFTVGVDTKGYVLSFLYIVSYGWRHAKNFFPSEPLFGRLIWLISRFSHSYTVLFAVVAGVFCFFVWRYIYKHSKDPVLSLIILLAFNFYQFSLTGMRQTIAISFILVAMTYMQEDKDLKSALFILLASGFHQSALVFALLLILKHIKLTYALLWGSVSLLIITFICRIQITEKLIFLLSDRGYEVLDNEAGLTMTFVIFILYVICIVFAKDYILEYEKKASFNFWVLFLATFFQILVSGQAIFFRISFYFLIALTTIVPNLFKAIQNTENQRIVTTSIYILLIAQYLFFTIDSSGILPYKFYWQ